MVLALDFRVSGFGFEVSGLRHRVDQDLTSPITKRRKRLTLLLLLNKETRQV